MAGEGARHLVLAGRRGAASPEARQTVKDLEGAGVQVLAEAVDVSDPGQVGRMLKRIAETLPPLRGILHTAMVLDDGALAQLTPERMEKVLSPKARGAWNLHRQTQDLPLEHFVLFSSISSLLGNPGQGNYVAANAFLDGLAQHRRAKGQCGLSVNWGVLAEVGVAAREEKVLEHLERMGIGALRPGEALAVLGRLMRAEAGQVGVVDLDWRRWAKANPGTSAQPFFGGVVGSGAGGEDSGEESISRVLSAASPDELPSLACSLLAQQVARITLLPVERVELHCPLNQLGIDSLMLIELQMVIQREFEVQFSVQELTKGDLASAAGLLLEKLGARSRGSGVAA
jgi:acyl carrier protein